MKPAPTAFFRSLPYRGCLFSANLIGKLVCLSFGILPTMDANLPEPLLNESNAAFIQGGVSITASSCNPDRTPAVARAVGCRVSPDRLSVTLLFSSPRADELFAAIRSGGKIAAVFSEPPTHRTLQLKGTDAKITSIQDGDSKINERYVQAFVAYVCPFGYSEELVQTLVACKHEDLAAVTFTVWQAFLQTPGPRAGEPLCSR